MKKSFNDVKLLDAALADESWEMCNARLRGAGLAALQAAKQTRTRWAIAGQITAMIAVIAGVWWSFNGMSSGNGAAGIANSSTVSEATRSSMASRPSAIASAGKAVSQEERGAYITEEQMLAMFPKGSCVLAEINGEKQLVVFQGKGAVAGTESAEAKGDAKL